MRITAAILWERGKPLSVEEAELDPPGPGEVLVEVQAAGVCHSDLHPARDDWPIRTPVVLGHEGAGIVREVGPGVTVLKAGDRVVFCWAPACGVCPPCRAGRAVLCDRLDLTTYRNRLPSGATRLKARGQPLAHFLGTACFADYAVVAEEGAVSINDDVPFEALAMLGCAVVTGVGAVMTAAAVPAGATVVVVGAGGVGLNVVQAARIAGCERVIGVDTRRPPLELARAFGATDLIDAVSNKPVDVILELTHGRGADFVFDTVGTPSTLSDAIAAARKGGTVVLTGLSRIDAVGSIPMFRLVMQEKRLVGSVYGSSQPAKDIRRLAGWYKDGRLKLSELVGRRYRLEQINEALGALGAGEGARGLVLR